MQNKNMLLFMVVCVVILFGSMGLQNWLNPQPKKPAVAPPKKPEAAAQQKPEPEISGWDKRSLSEQGTLKAAVWLVGQAALSGDAADLLRVKRAIFRVLIKPDRQVTPPTEEFETFPLGGKNHHLVVTLTSRGAGVQKVVLNKFKAANWLGQPAADKSDLELIPEDKYMPSFLMYHYEDPTFDVKARPVFTLGDCPWKVEKKPASEEENDQIAVFSKELPELKIKIVKTYILKPRSYHMEMSLKIEAREPRPFRYQLTGGHGLPIEGDWYTGTFRTAVMGIVDSNNSPSPYKEDSATISNRAGGARVPENIDQDEACLQYAGVMNQYFASVIVVDNEQAKKDKKALKFLHWARPTLESSEEVGKLLDKTEDTITLATQKSLELYHTLPSVAKHLKEANLTPGDVVTVNFYETSEGKKIATWARRGKLPRPALDDITVRVHSRLLELRPGDPVEHKFLLYHGPAKVKLLSQFSGDVPPELVDRYANSLNLRSMTDFGRFGWWSDLLTACSNLMHYLLYYLRFFGDGLSIFLLTALVRGLMFPISRKQAIFSVRMQELAPELKKIQEKFKGDAKGKTEATMELYRKYNVHPLGGCLPVLLQLPIFFGLYFALQESIHFRLASFLWMDNLAAPDMMIYWSDQIPWLSNPDSQTGFLSFLYLGPFFNLLPVIAVTLMIIQQKVMTPPPQDEQQAAQFKMMRYMMVFIGLMFYKIAAGLGMYIIISTLWGLVERKLLPKKKPLLGQPVLAPAPGTKPGPGNRKPPSKSAPPKKNNQMGKVRDWWQDVLKQARKK